MSRLLNFTRATTTPDFSGITRTQIVGPDDIVRTAEDLGDLSVEKDWGSRAYKAEIHFKNRNGSKIWATGIDTDFFTAIAKAVQEAHRLK